MKPSQLLASVMAMSSLSAALPDAFSGSNALAEFKNVLVGRQDRSSQSSAAPTESAKSSDSKQSGSSSPTASGSATESAKESSSGDSKATDKDQSGSGSRTTSKPTPTNFGPDVQPGGINMITPSAIAGSQLYKIDDQVTFVFNYTSLSISPTAVDVMATCTANQATYTIALNQSVEATHTVVWDTKNYISDYPNSAPLLTENYQLMIYDSNSSVSAAPKPGYLAPYKMMSFAMYTKQPYVEWKGTFSPSKVLDHVSTNRLQTSSAPIATVP
ncbi:hypothetical protein DM02DRAFT_608890 [Periconia macrospinosa]|uniref:DUF7137 domain-containing protein n=1 Tax=Periconia macrospinosa TaxID=97972 RepID=A0A2V1EB19_9PLEO|nr:hypothetical protein DM02DRAFT_608890 [Periconia macrospinosa]